MTGFNYTIVAFAIKYFKFSSVQLCMQSERRQRDAYTSVDDDASLVPRQIIGITPEHRIFVSFSMQAYIVAWFSGRYTSYDLRRSWMLSVSASAVSY